MLEQLRLAIRSEFPLLAVETPEEDRAVVLIEQVAGELLMQVHDWSVTAGLLSVGNGTVDCVVEPGKAIDALEYIVRMNPPAGIFIFRDLGPHCKEPMVHRHLREIERHRGAHFVLVESNPLPDSVRRLALHLTLPLPDLASLEKSIKETFARVRSEAVQPVSVTLNKRDFDQMAQSLRGLTCKEASRVIASAIHDDGTLGADDLPRVVQLKRNILQSAGCLESIAVNVAPDEIGGLANLKRWLVRRRGGLTTRGREFGLEPPRGMLLLGVQGCGKSLCAKAVAAEWSLPLLRMDPGVLYQKFIGESENRLRDALAQAEAMAPVVLWIDEIEKAFASASSDSADGGLSQRMFGTLLSWMQDHRSPIFMVATANNIAALPPELMRKGRFDEVFFVDLPAPDVRRQILAVHLRKRKRDPAKFALDALAAACDGFSGAEIEQAVMSAMYMAFADDAELSDDQLLKEFQSTRPLSVLMAERIRHLRSWASQRCVPAD